MLEMRRIGATPDDAESGPELDTVSELLWTEREILEFLLFKLTEERLVLASGSTRWYSRADTEVCTAVDRMRTSEVMRAAEMQSVARTLGLSVEATLGELASAAPEPWPLLLTDHRIALRALVLEVEAVAAENRRLREAGAKAIRETPDKLRISVSAFDATDGPDDSFRGPFFLDEDA
ncbi:MAG: flagellar protein FlgN [Actinomycetota bacterium]|nr:flagellar protein FlgN [Actinomycetota bacterium]